MSLGHRVAGLSATSVPVGEMQKPLPQSAPTPLSVPEPSVGISGHRPTQIDRGWLFLQCVVHRAPSLAPASGSWVSSATLAALPLHGTAQVKEQLRKAALLGMAPLEPEPMRPRLSEPPTPPSTGSWQGRQRLSLGSHFPIAPASPTSKAPLGLHTALSLPVSSAAQAPTGLGCAGVYASEMAGWASLMARRVSLTKASVWQSHSPQCSPGKSS